MTSIISAITGVFSEIATWIASAVTSITPMFYVAETGLTFLGVLAVCGLAFSVVFLISSFYIPNDMVRAKRNLCTN